MILDEIPKTAFARTLLEINADNWLFMLVQSAQAAGPWETFKTAVKVEIIPHDSIKRSRDKSRALHPKKSVSSYSNDFET